MDVNPIPIDRSWGVVGFEDQRWFGELGDSSLGIAMVSDEDTYDLCTSEHPMEQEFVVVEYGDDAL